MVRRGHTVLEVVAAYTLFAILIAAAAPDPRPAHRELRLGFEAEVARRILEGELARAETDLTRGAGVEGGVLDSAVWPAAPQLTGLRLERVVDPEPGGFALELRARWVGRDGQPRAQTLTGWLRGGAR